jgi:two-component system, OmpR family, alkaline phosphatase synthesis response regulator PhoP
MRILVVEDETELANILKANLEFEGFQVDVAPDGEPALARHRLQQADLIVLDLMLPKLDGFKVLELLRQSNDQVPVLMLTARGEERDRVRGLALGADDYLVKPFSMLEFIERIKAILRRTRVSQSQKLHSGPLCLDPLAMSVTLDGAPLSLTSKEYRLLHALISNPGCTYSRKELLQRAWEPDAWPTPRTVDSHIARLRKKLGCDEGQGWIVTVGTEGYRWTLPVQAE